VLTTHYLEEAEALCKRIAMLKLGKVVALDRTDALIRRISGSQLVLRLKRGSLPMACGAGHPSRRAAGRQCGKYTARQ
jgi:ABC-2 type transport system ATP-binding protein